MGVWVETGARSYIAALEHCVDEAVAIVSKISVDFREWENKSRLSYLAVFVK